MSFFFSLLPALPPLPFLLSFPFSSLPPCLPFKKYLLTGSGDPTMLRIKPNSIPSWSWVGHMHHKCPTLCAFTLVPLLCISYPSLRIRYFCKGFFLLILETESRLKEYSSFWRLLLPLVSRGITLGLISFEKKNLWYGRMGYEYEIAIWGTNLLFTG